MPAILAAVLPIIGGIFDRIFPDPAKKAEAMQQLIAQLSAADLEQMKVNAVEAGSASAFRGNWRPFIGWVCGLALAYQYLLVPLGTYAAAWANVAIPVPPVLDGQLWELMLGMLGMGALRTYEKIKGAA